MALAGWIHLKGFTEDFYARLCTGHLQPVLDILEYLVKETRVWVEITTLLIPGANDSDEELGAMSAWLVEHLGPQVPIHFTAFHPDWKMRDVGRTWCHHCGARLIERAGYDLGAWGLDAEGRCRQCGTACAGVFEAGPGTWGSRRQAVRLRVV